MYQSVPTHHNRYIKQTHPHPHHLTAPSFPPFHPHSQIPTQHFNSGPQPFQTQKPPVHASVNAQRWEDIIPQPVVNHPVIRPHEQTLTLRENSTGRKPSNKELLAKADLILVKSPLKQNVIPINRSSANKEQPRTSHNSHQPAQTLQTFSSPRPLHLETFTSPVRNAFEGPVSHPATITRSHAEFPPHAFVSPPREQLLHTLPTEYHSGPQQFYPPPHQFFGPNIIRHEGRPERIAYQIPAEIQHMPPQAIHERPVPLLQPAPRPGQVHHMPLESAQFPQSEFSEIRRDFVQLRLDSQPHELMETVTPTPFRTLTEEPVMAVLEFVPEITDDDEISNYIPETIPDSDRQSYGRYKKPRNNSVQKKLFAEPGYEKKPQQNQPEIGRRFNSGQQSGGSSVKKNPYRKDSSGNVGQFARKNRDSQTSADPRQSSRTNRDPEPSGNNGQFARVNRGPQTSGDTRQFSMINRDTQAVPSVRDTMGSNIRSSTSEYIEEKPRGTLVEKNPRETIPEKKQRESIPENPEKQSWAYRPKSENVNVKKEEKPKEIKTWIYSPSSERVNLKKEEEPESANIKKEEPKEIKTWIYSPNSESVNMRKEEIPKDSKTWIYSPNSEYVRREESPESKRKEREAKYTNKVEISLHGTNQKPNDRNRKVMKKVEQVLM